MYDVPDFINESETIIDPHFLEGHCSPIARFSPCEKGVLALNRFMSKD